MPRRLCACAVLLLAVLTALCAAFTASAGAVTAAPAAAAVQASPASPAAVHAASAGPVWRALWQTKVGAATPAAVINSSQDAWEVFVESSGGGSAIAARRVFAAGAASAPVVLVDGLTSVDGLLVQRDRHDGFVVVWRSGGAIWAERFTSAGAARYAPVRVMSDAEAATAGGVASATVAAGGVGVDSAGGFYVTATATASSISFGLIDHVNAAGALQLAAPGKVLPSAIAAVAVDTADHAFVLLQSTVVAVQRFSPALAADWHAVTLSATGGTALALNATSRATILWSQGGRYWLQRFSAAGKRVLPRPTTMAGGGHDASAAADGAGGTWVSDAVARGLRLRHVDAVGRFVGAGSAGKIVPLGLVAPSVGRPQTNRAGDLFVPYAGQVSGAARAGVARFAYTAVTTSVALTSSAAEPPLVSLDGAGGAFAAWRGVGSGMIARLGYAGRSLTCEPTATTLSYGSGITFSGYALSGPFVAPGARVTLRRRFGTGRWVTVASSTTSSEGFYAITVVPRTNCRWLAIATLAGHSTASVPVSVGVRVRVGIAVTRVRAGVLVSGSVAPGHAGATVSLQRLVGAHWTTIARLRLDRASAYRYTWRLPRRSVTARFRAVFPAHADNLGNDSATATVVFRFSTGALTASLSAAR